MYPYSIGAFTKMTDDISFDKHLYKTPSLPILHAHTNYEFMFVVGGEFTAICNNRFYDGNQPCIVFFNKGCYHGTARINSAVNPFERYCMYFDDCVFDHLTHGILGLDGILSQDFAVIPLNGSDGERLVTLLEDAVEHRASYMERIAYLLLISSCIGSLSKTNGSIIYGCFEDKYVLDAIKYIVSEAGEGRIATVSSLARKYNVCSSKLLGDFKKLTGSTPKNYVKKCTLDRSLRLLRDGVSVSETAELCGFSSTSYFIQFFNRQMKMSPGAYQKGEHHEW